MKLKQISKLHLDMNSNAIINRLARLDAHREELKKLSPDVLELVENLIWDADTQKRQIKEFRDQKRAQMDLSLKHGKKYYQ